MLDFDLLYTLEFFGCCPSFKENDINRKKFNFCVANNVVINIHNNLSA